VAKGMAEMTVRVRCERIVPVRGAVADLFKKTSVIVTRVIEVCLCPAHLPPQPQDGSRLLSD